MHKNVFINDELLQNYNKSLAAKLDAPKVVYKKKYEKTNIRKGQALSLALDKTLYDHEVMVEHVRSLIRGNMKH